MREFNEDSLVDMKFMTRDAGFTSRYFYKQIEKGNLPSPLKIGRSSRWKYRDYQSWKRSYEKNEENSN
ncbi:Predicted DNA-binding transcriptional regulator AlpA [Izhakiella capsodis]|uniref:Predicted DNA-binding transcriptional regulator AlpA n=1 Tax=Izhakiella capsodis TaxID=1367852 RepID=A0A1I4WI08_9GAMM|nr:Predicted DNA-binding transcriptional regulator AlpA [Izhakiella capsodis]